MYTWHKGWKEQNAAQITASAIREAPVIAQRLKTREQYQSTRRDALLALRRAGWMPVNRYRCSTSTALNVSAEMTMMTMLGQEIAEDWVLAALEAWLANAASERPSHERWFFADAAPDELLLLALDAETGP